MKKILITLLLTIGMTTLAACGGEKQAAPEATSTTSETPAASSESVSSSKEYPSVPELPEVWRPDGYEDVDEGYKKVMDEYAKAWCYEYQASVAGYYDGNRAPDVVEAWENFNSANSQYGIHYDEYMGDREPTEMENVYCGDILMHYENLKKNKKTELGVDY